eukprot:CAMPEP_0172499366 /NCGR_PEP_ID=MMETSP1066-20121228/126348_1 /TAXON_ID=671091 /ORGANISM="Coscinodiscus wailesii, Strain CCMP2513" /LENGTH=736 /DNA_ID=CAMNT_0013273075 /DNA_START=251 /DNA_END=2461 /DNA_ORIENTATION=-
MQTCHCHTYVEDVIPETNDMMVNIISFLSTMGLMFSGFYIIGKFLADEYKLAKKKSEDKLITFTWEEQFSYRLDYYLSSSQWAKPSLLLSGTFILIFIGAASLSLVAGHSISGATWLAWTYVADPGTHADAEGALVRFVSFMITIGGMLVFALMIGIISDAIGEKVDELRKGKSRVIESNHTLMLGWSDKSLAIIQQIAMANESEGGGIIVVLAEHDKEEMEATLRSAIEIREHGLDLMGTEVVFRSGNPLMEHDLRKVSVLTARSIIALSAVNEDPDESDSKMVRQVLSLKAFEQISCHVVVEMQDIDNKSLIQLVAPELAEVVVVHDIIGRLMIQCAREPGLAHILESLMGFEGDEFYIEHWKQLEGRKFKDILCRFDDAVPVGVKETCGTILLNPDDDYIIGEGCSILCLAEDNDTYTVNDGSYDETKCGKVPKRVVMETRTEKLLFCGWRRDLADMITQLDEYVKEGSELWLFNTVPVKEREELLKDKGSKEELDLKNLLVKNAVGNPIIQRDLRKLVALDYKGKPTGEIATLDEFDSVLILADAVAIQNGADMKASDSRSLASLLIIQDLQRRIYKMKKDAAELNPLSAAVPSRIPAYPISEILDARTRSLLRITDCKGFVMSNQIISAAIAQIAEDRDMNVVLGVLLSAEGSETYIKPISWYLDLEKEKGKRYSFWDIALRARQKGHCAIGYKPASLPFEEARDVMLNPPNKSQKREWQEGDIVIVFAEE